jgi:polyhydroxyalkanoate synthesis regulator phasin
VTANQRRRLGVVRRKWLLAAGGAAVAAVVGIGVVTAQDGGDEDGRSFLDRVAEKLGIDTPQLEDAIRDARNDEIDERVEAGDLTQEQAERLKERLDDLPDGAFGGEFGFGFGLKGHGGFAFKFSEGVPGLAISAGLDHAELADFLGISEEQLTEELGTEGATFATVAEAHGKSRGELKAFIEGEAKATLDEAVGNGRLTQERADEILENLREHIDRLIDKQFPFPGKGGPFFHHRPFRWDEAPFSDDGDREPQEQDGELEPASRS